MVAEHGQFATDSKTDREMLIQLFAVRPSKTNYLAFHAL